MSIITVAFMVALFVYGSGTSSTLNVEQSASILEANVPVLTSWEKGANLELDENEYIIPKARHEKLVRQKSQQRKKKLLDTCTTVLKKSSE